MARVKKVTNEIIIFIPEGEYRKELMVAFQSGGTPQISIDRVRDFRTPFGTHMIIATLTVQRANAGTWDLRDYVARLMTRAGLSMTVNDVLAPGKPQFYSVH